MGLVEELTGRLPVPGPRLVLPEGGDDRVLDAALRIGAAGFARPLLFADPAAISTAARAAGIDPGVVTPVDPEAERSAELVDRYAAARGVPAAVASRVLRRPEVLGAAMVAAGRADTMMAGATTTTRDVLMACAGTLGPVDRSESPSSFFLLETLDGRDFLFADCAVNPDPDAAQLAVIAVQTAASARLLFGREPRVAMLSFSTRGSADHPQVEKVRAAVALARAADPALLIDGELQADAAVDPEVAARKLDVVGPVAGRADVLVFPDLTAGNIAYKLVRSLGGATAVGVVLQGYRRPVCDLSRGATVEEMVASAVVLAALVQPAPTGVGASATGGPPPLPARSR